MQLLHQSYKKYEKWVTPLWFKTLYEKCDLLNVVVEFNDVLLDWAQEGDKWLMAEFQRIGYTGEALFILNHVRIYLHALFLSDILGASGKRLDNKYLKQRPPGQRWSKWIFPWEQPARRDFRLWDEAVKKLVPEAGVTDRLGPLRDSGQKRWDWRLDHQGDRLIHHRGEVIDIYHLWSNSTHNIDRIKWIKVSTKLAEEYEGDV